MSIENEVAEMERRLIETVPGVAELHARDDITPRLIAAHAEYQTALATLRSDLRNEALRDAAAQAYDKFDAIAHDFAVAQLATEANS